jgi:putative N6-adenine-specific DNA methylase
MGAGYILVMPFRLACFATCAVGLEPVLAAELRALSRDEPLEPAAAEPGGVGFRAGWAGLYAANLHLRTASRVLLRLGEFHASAFHELERHARALRWGDVVAPGGAMAFRVTSRKSKLYHQDAVAERLLGAVATHVPQVHAAPASGEEEDASRDPRGQRIVVRLFRDRCTVSADSSGELLHRRGYRLATGKAPLRETLAAAMLLALEWDGATPLLDPMCGSGTLPIEAALLSRRIPPGLRRGFQFETWPGFDAEVWRQVRESAVVRMRSAAPLPLLGSDRDHGAVESARANAERAGVSGDIEFSRSAISGIAPPDAPGLLLTNPPYGVRIGERLRLRDLFAQLGNVARRRCPGWRVGFLSAHEELERQTALPLRPVLETLNGGIRVRLVQGLVPVTPAALS